MKRLRFSSSQEQKLGVTGHQALLESENSLDLPLCLTSNQHQLCSPNNILISLREKVKRCERENALIFYQILPTNSLRKCIEISLENLRVNIWSVADPGEGLRGAGPLPPLSKGLDDPPLPPPPHLKVWIQHCWCFLLLKVCSGRSVPT